MQNISRLKRSDFNKKNIKVLPQGTGVYIYYDKGKHPIYVGKAKDLRARVRSYVTTSLNEKTAKMIAETKSFSAILVGSELEALLLEARLVKKYQTRYNSVLRDDKHPIYIRITDEEYPRVLTARKPDEVKRSLAFLGPFPSTTKVRSVLRLLRQIFPYSQHKLGKRGCLYSQMSLCNPCPNEIEKVSGAKEKKKLKSKYRKNISYVKAILSGRFLFVSKSLEKVMRGYAKEENFEMAAIVRNQIASLDYITQPVTPVGHFLKNPNLLEDIRTDELKELRNFLSKYLSLPDQLSQIECYDVAHLAGTNATASMVTFTNGDADKSLYRHFRIHQKKGQSDTDSMYEVAKRRVKYLSTWGVPDLIIVDGGKAQVSVFRRIFGRHKIPVVGIAKREEKIVIPGKRYDLSTHGFIERKLPKGPARNLVQRIRNEAHRFARRYHHKLLQKELIPK